MTETAQGHAELLSLVKRAQLIVDDAYENWHAAAAAALSTPIAVTEAHIDLVLDAAGDYMGVQYGNAALLHPTDRARIKATLSRPQEEARGEWVRYIAHADALAALRAELAAAQETITTGIEQEQHLMSRLGIETRAREAAEAEVARLKDENKALVAGLEPFAEAALNVKETTPGRFVHVTPNGTYNDLSFISLPPPAFVRARSLTAAKGE